MSGGGWVYDDGGRAATGRRLIVDDCGVRALAIALERPYNEIYSAMYDRQRRACGKWGIDNPSPRLGVHYFVWRRYLTARRWRFSWPPSAAPLSDLLADLPSGRLVLHMADHACAVVDQVVHDVNPLVHLDQHRVYGYFYRPGTAL